MNSMPSKALHQGILPTNSMISLKSALSISRVKIVVTVFLLSWKILNYHNHWWQTITTSPMFTITTSLFTSNRSWKVPFLVGFLCTCIRKLSSRYFRNLPDLIVSAVWYSPWHMWFISQLSLKDINDNKDILSLRNRNCFLKCEFLFKKKFQVEYYTSLLMFSLCFVFGFV